MEIDIIKEILKERRMTVSTLSKKAGIPRSYLYTLLNRNHNPTIKTLKKLADALDINIEDLFKNKVCK
jgi:transcriptional regulator with XRE-family HTH domain